MATAPAATTAITAEQFLAMDLGPGTHELVRGEVVTMPPAGPRHGRICFVAGSILERFGAETGFGYVVTNDSVVVTTRDPDTARGADVCFYRRDRTPDDQLGDGPTPLPPDVVVEVWSPGNRAGDMLEKVREYLEAGVPMVWLLHPARKTLAVHRGDDPVPVLYGEGEAVEGLPELPGFACRVAEFFE